MERTDAKHSNRISGFFDLNGRKIEIVITRHGDYRKNSVAEILEDKNVRLDDLTKLIAAIGVEDLEHHFEEAEKVRNPNEKDWRKEIDYRIAIYDVIDGIVIMLGIHPHLNRITIPTIISKSKRAEVHDIFGVYRIDCDETKYDNIQEIITQPFPPKSPLKLKRIILKEY